MGVPLSEFIPPLPSTTSSLINNPSPINDPLSLQRPHPSSTTPLLSTNPSPINDLILYQPHPLLFINHFLTNMTTHTKNTHHLASVTVQVAENLTSASAFEMPDIVAERLKALPTSCEYSGLAYFPPSSFGEVLDCILLLGFSSDKALENWVSQLFGRHIDKPVDKLPGIVEAICRGKVGEGDDWASKLGEPNKAQLN